MKGPVMTKSTLARLGVRRIRAAQGITEYRLQSNGLTILFKEDLSTPAVNFMVEYRCGSRHEGAGTTGSAHFFEHLMFKGTRAFDPMEGNGVFDVFNRVGGILNADTSYDRTRYFECVPAESLELCVRIEADRMRNLKNRKADRDSEMTVVRNEFERNENNPGSALYKEVLAAAFKDHPYHHPVIGARSDVEGIPMKRMVEFYDKFYWPNNATVIVVGKFDTEQTLRWISKYFGRIPRSPKAIPLVYTVEPQQEGERRIELRRAGSLPQILIAHHTPAAIHPDIYALSVLGDVLGDSSSPSSRLYKALVETGKVRSVGAGAFALKDPGLFNISASLTQGTSLAEVEAIIIRELEKLVTEPATEDELRRIKAANRKGTLLQSDDPLAYAKLISNGVGIADWKWNLDYDDHYDAVSAADIQRVAATYFSSSNRTVGVFIPTVTEKKVPAKGAETKPRTNGGRKQKRLRIESTVQPTDFAQRVIKTVLPNGLTVCILRRGQGVVAVHTAIPAGSYFTAPDKRAVAGITADMLTAGSTRFTKEQIGDVMQEMGTELDFSADRLATRTGNLLPVQDFAQFIEVLAEVTINPVLSADELKKKLPSYNANALSQLTDNSARARNAFSRVLYPEGHPFRPGTLEEGQAQLATVTADDLKRFHAEHFTPQGAVISIVGDIDPDVALEVVRKHFGSWTGPARKPVSVPQTTAPLADPSQKEIRVALPGKANVDMVLGHATDLNRRGADFFAARIACNALGEDPIADRLGKVVRSQHGLTYGVNASFGDASSGSAPWTITISVAPENIAKAQELIRQVVDQYLLEGISEDELQDKIGNAVGSQIVNLRHSAGISGAICSYEFAGLGVAAIDAVIDGYRSVTKADVDAAIRRYFDLSTSVTVIAGTFA